MGKSTMKKRSQREKTKTPDRKGPENSVESCFKGGSKASKNIKEVSVNELSDMISQYE